MILANLKLLKYVNDNSVGKLLISLRIRGWYRPLLKYGDM